MIIHISVRVSCAFVFISKLLDLDLEEEADWQWSIQTDVWIEQLQCGRASMEVCVACS